MSPSPRPASNTLVARLSAVYRTVRGIVSAGRCRVRVSGQPGRLGDVDLVAVTKLEIEVWDALRRGDADADARLLAEDFLGVYATGFADRSDHVGQLADGPTVAEFELFDARLMVLSRRDVMLSYRAEWRRYGADSSGARESMYISSLWSQRDGRWVNVFSQDSPADIRA